MIIKKKNDEKMIVNDDEKIVINDEKIERMTRQSLIQISIFLNAKENRRNMTNVKLRKFVINVNLQIILSKFVQNKKKNQKIKKSKNLIIFIQIQQQKIDFIDIDDMFESIFNENFDCFIESLNVAKTIRRRFRRIQVKTIKVFAKRKFVIIFSINIDVIFEKKT